MYHGLARAAAGCTHRKRDPVAAAEEHARGAHAVAAALGGAAAA